MPQRRKKMHKSKRNGLEEGGLHKRLSMKHKTKDFDQIVSAINNNEITLNGDVLKKNESNFDEDKIGGGQFYCGVCDKYFISQEVLDKHKKQGPHKLKVKKIQKEKPWTVEDARGRVDNGPKLNRKPTDTDI